MSATSGSGNRKTSERKGKARQQVVCVTEPQLLDKRAEELFDFEYVYYCGGSVK
jgi:hypothetical protein